MKTIKQFLFLFIAVIFICSIACKKYPDGPLLNIYTKQHRIAGSGDVEYISVNGYDYTNYLKSQLLYGKYKFWAGKGDRLDGGEFVYTSNDNNYISGGDWQFINNKKQL